MRTRIVSSSGILGRFASLPMALGLDSLPEHTGSSGVSAIRRVVAKSAFKALCVGLMLEQGSKICRGASTACGVGRSNTALSTAIATVSSSSSRRRPPSVLGSSKEGVHIVRGRWSFACS